MAALVRAVSWGTMIRTKRHALPRKFNRLFTGRWRITLPSRFKIALAKAYGNISKNRWSIAVEMQQDAVVLQRGLS
jgi:hypothetical protein